MFFRPVSELSKGYRQRVGLAAAILHPPEILVLDEPTSGLDPVQIVHMRKLIRRLKERHTIIVSSHILNEIHQLCDRIFVLQDGKIVAKGSEDELAGRVSRTTTIALEVRGPAQELAAQRPPVRHAMERCLCALRRAPEPRPVP